LFAHGLASAERISKLAFKIVLREIFGEILTFLGKGERKELNFRKSLVEW